MSSAADNPSSVIVQAPPAAATNHGATLPSPSARLLSVISSLAPRRRMASLRRLWTHYYSAGAFGEEALLMPESTLNFVVNGLLGFIEIKAQGQAEFPFQTHPHAIMVAITSLLIFGLASAVKYIFSSAGPAPSPFYAVVAHLGRMASLLILLRSIWGEDLEFWLCHNCYITTAMLM